MEGLLSEVERGNPAEARYAAVEGYALSWNVCHAVEWYALSFMMYARSISARRRIATHDSTVA